MNQALIVIMPNPKDAAKPWLGFSIEDAAKHFPNGGALVVSLHSTNIRFVIGEHKYMLKPGDQYDLWLLTLRVITLRTINPFRFSAQLGPSN
jgi:hypothetical protein